MLAAKSPGHENYPALFNLALQILSANRRLPDQMKTHIKTVIAQALEISADPNSIRQETLAEAIQLALEIQTSTQFKSEIESTLKKEMTADVAKKILALERDLAPAR